MAHLLQKSKCSISISSFSNTWYFKHAQIQKLLSEGVKLLHRFFVCVFLVDERRDDPNTTKSGPSPPRIMAQHWFFCTLTYFGSFVIFQGIWSSIAKKPYFVIFQEGSGPHVPPLDPPMSKASKCVIME